MASLLDLPVELLDPIVAQLPYPDLLSLKITCRYFHDSIHPTVRSRVSWLMSRTKLGLPILQSGSCDLKTDAGFCSNPEVQQILRNRWQHKECRNLRRGRCAINPDESCKMNRSLTALANSSNLVGLTGLFVRGNISLLLALLLSMLVANTILGDTELLRCPWGRHPSFGTLPHAAAQIDSANLVPAFHST
jgi:hypothetical protein